ncbi:MAG: transcriptional regulator, partial [Planctomycetes bacterium]|nr:transcriptional regulator [Planctomycetota bacterium]
FYMWYWGCHGMAHMGKVIIVNPESKRAAQRIGFEPAPTLDSAIDMAKEFVGRDAQITYYHCPPVMMCDLT